MSENGTDHETLDDIAEQAAEEWDYQTFEGQFGQEQNVSIPCQLRFTEEPEQRTQKFHEALKVHNFTPLDSRPVSDTEPFYDGEVCSTDHHNRIRVLVFRGDLIRIYPKDDYVPEVSELACLLHAITIGFRADLEHDPIEDNRSVHPGNDQQ